ncbi:glutathione S-transferase theta-1-like [Mizuhopecten yessoensis]|uniref:Glutathione S-transferase theta-1 n=1 Tax=Mizuhopecten yessoensis TaxID=6573 RepID=A0A210R2Y9_MIZYE|nr:glutathione S-transferase theta-1-like [Mizuhopecten yessoensis]OWF55347.1 Glutathione S-transferase theta-1 [Mizuhopecten yessoensis]
MALKLYYDFMSQPCRAAFIFLKLNKIPFEHKRVALRNGEHRSADFKKISPISLVPVIDDDGFILTESVAILKYLALKHNVPDHWYPRTDLKAQARIDEYLNYQHFSTRLNMAMLFQNLAILPRLRNKPVDWKQVEKFRKGTEVTVNQIDQYFLKDNRPYLAGDDISLADLVGICEVMQLYACCEERFVESNLNVNSWLERVKPQLDPYFDESNVMVNKVREHFLKTPPVQPKL